VRQLYLVVSETGSFTSKCIRFFTKDGYTHISLSVNAELTEMYTFGRRYVYSVYPGGFVKEQIHKRIYKRFKNTRIVVLKLSVSDEQYDKIVAHLREMYLHKKEYTYNFLGAILVRFNKTFKRKNCYYCSEFIWELFHKYDLIDMETYKSKTLIRPMEFLRLGMGEIVYRGKMRDYDAKKLQNETDKIV